MTNTSRPLATEPLLEAQMLRLCGSALRKIDKRGRRGTEMVTLDEIEAMAAMIDVTGKGHICLAALQANPSEGDLI